MDHSLHRNLALTSHHSQDPILVLTNRHFHDHSRTLTNQLLQEQSPVLTAHRFQDKSRSLTNHFSEGQSFLSIDYELSIGQEFPDVDTCLRTLKDIAIAQHFELRVVKSDRNRFIAKCSKEGCPWRIHVAKCPEVSKFTIRTLHGEHTCEGLENVHHQASVGWVARSVESRIRANPQYKPKEILQHIRDQHGVAMYYMLAWRGKERSMTSLHGTFEERYMFLPSYCEQIRITNPGSMASVVATGQDNCFQRLFVSYSAAIYGFINACRPLLELDRVHLKGKYLGMMFYAAAVDAEDSLFPLALAVVDIESDENWMWFMSELRKLLGVNTDTMPRVTILSERTKATEFERMVSEMVEISQDVLPWLHLFDPQLWAVAYFDGVRYSHFTPGVTELLFTWALECHELPIVQMMEHIRHQMTSWFNDRRNMSMSLASILMPCAEKRISEAIADARCYKVLRANEVEFEIVLTERTNIVDIRSRVCSCRHWQLYGLPCAHAAAALISCGQNAHIFAERCFTVHNYRETYSQMIYPIPDRNCWKEPGEGTEGRGAQVDTIIRSPTTRPPHGRPKKKVLRVESLKRPKRVVQCGLCHMLGHSQKNVHCQCDLE
ncbi:hypothetical protein LIER_10634 [Lithospermum erythrorhizon]|uniref:SWIM-type domain-containing protein n=1 Tax=Lithospermum erythrorhizon TaxID=34254 RepID=A0AAV3PPC3_LITER